MIERIHWSNLSKFKEYTPFILLFAFTLPFKNAYSNIVVVLYVLYTVVSFVRKKANYSFDPESFMAIKYLPVLFMIFVFSLLYSTDILTGFSSLGKMSYLLVIPLLFCFYRLSTNEKRAVLTMFVYSNLGAILFNVGRASSRSLHLVNDHIVFDASVLGGQPFWYSIVQGGNYFFYDELSYFLHPTYWAIYLLFCVFIILDSIFSNLSTKKLMFSLILVSIFLTTIFLCSSRIIILSTAILLSVYSIIVMAQKRSWYWILASAFVILILLTAIAINPRFIGFENLSTLETFHHSRLEAWRSAVEVLKENPIFGVGIGDSENLLMQRHQERGYLDGYMNRYNEHNQYLHVANASGILGLTAFLLSIGTGFRKSIRNKNYLQFAFLFSFVLVCTVENILVRRAGVVYFAFFYCLLFIPSNEHEK